MAMATNNALSRHRLQFLDRAFFLLESDEATCHVGLLALFAPPESAGPEFVRDLVAQLRSRHDVAAPFTYKLARRRPPLFIGPWLELDAAAVDLDYHLRHSALPRPGTQRDLGVLISRLHPRPLDPSRPMWEQHIIDGLEDGRFALYFKVHHSLMDGVTGTGMFAQSLNVDPADITARPIWSVAPPAKPDSPGVPNSGRAHRVAATVRAIGGARQARRSRGTARDDRTMPFSGPVSPTLNGRVSRQRRVVTQSYDLARFRTVAKSSGVSLNDVFLAVCSSALSRYLEEIGETQVRSLTASVPVALPADPASVGGNSLGMLAARLHTDIADPAERLRAINRSTVRAKQDLLRLPPELRRHQAAFATSPLMIQSLIGLAGRGGRPHANLVLSNVPGPPGALYLGGARLEEAYPLFMLMHGQTLNITAYTAGSRINIGVVGCRDQLPHLQKMAGYLAEGLAELEAVGSPGG